MITVGARSSPLSKAQVREVFEPLSVEFKTCFVATTGDLDQKTSLRTLDKTNFFTKELDEMVLNKECHIAIHSAKDLPEPIPKGLTVVALTKGVDNSDSLVIRPGETLESLPSESLIATSSGRREECVKNLRPDFKFTDIRGNIGMRLEKLNGEVDGVVVAEAALIRLGLTHLNRIRLPGKTADYQGQLAVLARVDDKEMQELFFPLDCRKKVLYLGLTKPQENLEEHITHYPVITIEPKPLQEIKEYFLNLKEYTHLLFTSKSSVAIFFDYLEKLGLSKDSLSHKKIMSIGKSTKAFIEQYDLQVDYTATVETSEGIIEKLKRMNLEEAYFFWPHSAQSQETLSLYFKNSKIRYTECILYDTLLQKLNPVPDLKNFQKIVFTSPSTVQGFLNIYGYLPNDKILSPIGPVTEKKLFELLNLHPFPTMQENKK